MIQGWVRVQVKQGIDETRLIISSLLKLVIDMWEHIILFSLLLNMLENFHMLTYYFKQQHARASLVTQWLRVCLPMQGTRVRALVWEDPTCRGATRPVSHNY